MDERTKIAMTMAPPSCAMTFDTAVHPRTNIATTTMAPPTLPQQRSSYGWISFRNVLMTLIVMQITVLIAIGFSAPSESSLEDFLRPAESALDSFLSSLKQASDGGTRTIVKSLDESIELWKKLSDQWEQVGPYDTPGAFTQNFLPERKHPSFRRAMPSVEDLDKAVKRSMDEVTKLTLNEKFIPCQYHEIHHGTLRVLRHEACQFPYATNIVAYNSMPFDRKWCKKTIKAHSIQHYDKICQEPVLLFNVQTPQANGKRMPPIRLLRKKSGAKQERVDCDLPCVATIDTCDAGEGEVCLPGVSNWIVEDTDMTFTYSMMTATRNRNLVVDPKAYRQGKHLATRSFQSEIPLSYFSWEKYGTPMPAVDYDEAVNGKSFFKSKLCKGRNKGRRLGELYVANYSTRFIWVLLSQHGSSGRQVSGE